MEEYAHCCQAPHYNRRDVSRGEERARQPVPRRDASHELHIVTSARDATVRSVTWCRPVRSRDLYRLHDQHGTSRAPVCPDDIA
jgi:hypothetical protein